jgi:hypothetical protein
MTSAYWKVEALIISDPCRLIPGPNVSQFKFTLKQAKKAKIWGVGVEVQLYSFFMLGARWGCVVNATPRALYPWERDPVFLEHEAGWTAGSVLKGAISLSPQRDSIPGPHISENMGDFHFYLQCFIREFTLHEAQIGITVC